MVDLTPIIPGTPVEPPKNRTYRTKYKYRRTKASRARSTKKRRLARLTALKSWGAKSHVIVQIVPFDKREDRELWIKQLKISGSTSKFKRKYRSKKKSQGKGRFLVEVWVPRPFDLVSRAV